MAQPTETAGVDPLAEFRSDQEWLYLNHRFWIMDRPSRSGLMWPRLPSPRDDSLSKVVALARIPTKRGERMLELLAYEIDREQYWHMQSLYSKKNSRKVALAQLKRLAEASSKLDATLQNLNVSAFLALVRTVNLPSSPQYPPPLDEPGLVLYKRMTEAFAGQSLAALAVRQQSKPRRGRGRPASGELRRPGEPGSLIRFTLRLLWDVAANGGRLTLDRNSGKGTLVEALNILRLHLPRKFVPRELPVSTLARVKAMAAKAPSCTGKIP
jgi:hypothetical protein